MISLPVKYRPKTLDEVVGQDSVIQVLKRQIETGNIKNAYLFCGSSGTGKTSASRAMADAINKGKGSPIEIDAASNNGVEYIRQIVQDAKERSVDSEYKILTIDECFVPGTLISTPHGQRKIEDIRPGDEVFNLTGVAKVRDVVSNKVPANRLVEVKLSNGTIITCTSDHLFMTYDGFVCASELSVGEELIYVENMRSVWGRVQHHQEETKGLLGRVRTDIDQEEQRLSGWLTTLHTYMCSLWENMGDYEEAFPANMLEGVLFHIVVSEPEGILRISVGGSSQEIVIRESKDNSGVWNTHSREGCTGICKDEGRQSVTSGRGCAENAGDSEKEWYTWVPGDSWGEWETDCSAVEALRIVRRALGTGISCKNTLLTGERVPLSYLLQVRPRLTREKNRHRGGWQYPQIEKSTSIGYKEGNFANTVRVESVEVHQRGGDDRCGQCDTTHTAVYDLTIEGHPSYFANGVLVHNCHVLSGAAWQAFLKCIEEPPKYTIFILCTTDPQKIPATILNRVQRFNFTKIPSNLILDRLTYVCQQEGYSNYEETIQYISKTCDGCMREALTLLGKVADAGNTFEIGRTISILGGIPYSTFFDITNAFIDGDEAKVLQIIDEVEDSGSDLKLFIDRLLKFTVDVTKYILFKNCNLTTIPVTYESEIKNIINFDSPAKYYNYLMDKLLAVKSAIRDDMDVATTVRVLCLQITRMQ